MERRVLSRDVLDELLSRATAEGVHLSDVIVAGEIVSEHDLAAAVASELGMPFIDVSERSILPDVWGLVPEDLARAYMAVAVERRDAGVVVVMDDPDDEQVVAALESDLGVTVHPAVAVRTEVARLIYQMYGANMAPGPSVKVAPADVDTVAVDPRAARVQLDDLLDEVMRVGGSDLHLTVGSPPAMRVQGELRRMDGMAPLNGSDVRRLVLGVLTERQRERFLELGELATSHAIPGRGRFRVAAFVQRDSVGAVLRLVPGVIPTPEDLGLPDEVIAWADHRRGLVLVCGPHGSGTSTTLAALVDHINRSRACHILTLEQPIEFLHQHRAALVNQREVGEDTASFARGLRHAVRQDPDVLVVGELSDAETIRLALAAAETGQLVLATLRTVDAVKTIAQIVDVFPTDQQSSARLQLANTLRGIVVQQLVPAIGGGVALAAEVLLPTADVTSCIRSGDNANLAKAILGGASVGMGTMDQSLAELVLEGLVDIDAAAERAVDPTELRYLTSGPT